MSYRRTDGRTADSQDRASIAASRDKKEKPTFTRCICGVSCIEEETQDDDQYN